MIQYIKTNFLYSLIAIAFIISASANAAITWDSKTSDPEVKIGDEKVEFEFKFSNQTKLPMVIEQPVASCGCTVLKLEKLIYAPGEKGVIAGIYHVSGRHGKNQVTIKVNGYQVIDGTQQPFSDELQLNVAIPELLTIRPAIILWRKDSDITTKSSHLYVNGDISLGLRLIQPESTFKCELIEVIPGHEYIVNASPVSTNDAGQSIITLEGRLPHGKILKFYLHLLIR